MVALGLIVIEDALGLVPEGLHFGGLGRAGERLGGGEIGVAEDGGGRAADGEVFV